MGIKRLAIIITGVILYSLGAYSQSSIEIDGITYTLEEDQAAVTAFKWQQTDFEILPEVTFETAEGSLRVPVTVIDLPKKSLDKFYNTLYIPSSITYISADSFYETNVEKLYIDDLTAWCNIEFDYHWSSGNTYISYTSYACPISKNTEVYIGNELVKTLVIPNNIEEISYFAFMNLNCEKIVIGSGVRNVGVQAFMGSKVKVVELGHNVEELYQESFAKCENLQTLKFSGSPTIDYKTFEGTNPLEVYCPSLEEWLSIKYYWAQLDGGYLGPQISDSYDLYIGGEKMEDIVIPAVKEELNSFCFAGANIRSAVFEEGIIYPGNFPFWGCSHLESVVFPSTMEYGGCAFVGCVSLKQVQVNRTTPPSYNSLIAFDQLGPSIVSGWLENNKIVREQCVLYVPAESVEIYAQSKGWRRFKEVLPIPDSAVDKVGAETQSQKQIYDLNGRKVSGEPEKGIYIINGKKVMMR